MEKTIDPRILRTKRLIMDAFMQLAIEKDFKDITIKDITSRATVNRATLYYHFYDKYDLLEKVLSEDVLKEVLKNVGSHEALSERSLKNILLSLISFQRGLASQCSRSYEAFTPKIETIVKQELGRIFCELLKGEHPTWADEKINLHSIMISWTLYGISTEYVKNGEQPTEDVVESIFKALLLD
ncbi:TetR family transcriptional regulator [Paenibacillus odorifer]|uniref:TetR/AcrR family transcriptional regulator n=1 Tax=Paenibacillus TaxID=44249 RepID=UPI00096CB8E5|nr:TetR/AcrR family transcriptional regulator [Paenibacillus odorifer]OMD83976.1 TetR family transcriptional regulator [Paenibacillus odorifer]